MINLAHIKLQLMDDDVTYFAKSWHIFNIISRTLTSRAFSRGSNQGHLTIHGLIDKT